MPDPNLPVIGRNVLNSDKAIFDKVLKNAPNLEPFVSQPMSQIPLERYKYVQYGGDNEEMYARAQSGWDQFGNGLLKAVGTFTSSFAAGTVGLINGLGEMASQQRAAAFFDNSFNRSIDRFNKSLEDALPNYYTQAEKSADWYSPTNIFTGNFWGDKVFKNLGFSAGALVGGMGWGAVLKGIGLTSRLVAAGRGLQALEATETAMANAPRLQQLGAINKSLASAWNSTKGVIGSGLINADRAIVSAFGTTGEASIEALEATNNFRNKLIQEHKNTYGAPPNQLDLEKINSLADKVGNNIFAANVALLTATNYIQLPKILGSSKSLEKGAINSINRELVGETAEVAGRTITRQTEKFVAGTPTTGNIFSPVVSRLGKPGRFIDKYVLGPGRLLVSGTEAFEEGAQFSIQAGTEDYFERAYKHKGDAEELLGGIGDVLGSIFTEGVRKTLTSKEGMESILIGGISGGIQKAFGKSGNIAERGFSGLGGRMARDTQIALDSLNKTNLDKVLKDGKKFLGIAIGSQELRQESIKNDDTFNEKNYENDYTLSYIMPRVKYEREEGIYHELDKYKEQVMKEGGFEELQELGYVMPGETKEKFIQRLENIRTATREVKKVYDHVNNKYSGLVDKEGKILYTPEVIDKMVYAASKVTNFDQRLVELEAKLLANGKVETTDESDNVILKALIDTNRIKEKLRATNKFKDNPEQALNEDAVKEEIEKTIADIRNNNGLENDELERDFTDYTEALVHRQMYINDYLGLKNSPEKFKEKEEVSPSRQPAAPPPPGETTRKIKVNTARGELDLDEGTEYYSSRRVEVKEVKGGKQQITRFTVIGETSEGKVEIKTSDGKTLEISKSEFEKLSIGKVSDVTSDNAKFFIDTHDHIFTYNRGGGKLVEGTLKYDKDADTLTFESLDGKFVKRVTRDQFSPKQGFTQAQIYSNKRYTPVAEQSLTQAVTVEEKIAAKNEIIADLYENSKKTLDEINEKLEANKKKLSETVESLENLSKTKEGLPKKRFTKAVRKTIDTLSKIKTDIENEISQLESEKNELEAALPYLQQLSEDAQSVEDGGENLIRELKEEVSAIEEMIDSTNDAIKTGKSLLTSVESALSNALSLMNDFVKRLREENPNVPLSIEELRDRLEKYQGEEGARQFIADRLGFTDLVIELEDQIESFGEELKIPDLTARVAKLTSELQDLQKGLDGLIEEQIAKQKALDVIEEYAERIRKQKEEEAKLKKNEELRKQLLGTNSNDTANTVDENPKSYQPEAKKSDLDVVGSTIASSYEDAKKPFNQRANRFGTRVNSLKNRDDIRGIVVTAKTEDQIIPGLTGKLVEGTNIPTDGVIALVMVQDNGDGTFTPVDEFGVPIPQGANLLDLAVFQVFPESKLTANYNGQTQTMFRDTTPDYVEKALREQYAKWREERLKETELGEPKTIKASFGIPKYVTYKNSEGKDEIDYDARTSAQDAGLITDASLVENHLITVATNNDSVSNGSVTFKTPLGRVFLKVPGGMAKLFNAKFSKKKATLIYDVIHQLAKNTLEDGSVKTEKSEKLITWLKTVVYWGIPKNTQTGERKEAKLNSVFFEDVPAGDGTTETRLFVSGRGASFEFSPTGLEQNKDAIIALLQGMYHNANATSLNAEGKFKQPYFEITGLDKQGNPIYKEWKNYQSYLLSNKDADGTKRTEDIPLTTVFRPLKSADDVNREGVYFTLEDTIDDYVIPQKPVVTPAPAAQAPKAPGAPAQPAPSNSYKLDGTMETMSLGTFGNIEFSIKGDVLAEIMQKQTEETGKPFEVTVEVQKELIDKKALDFSINDNIIDAVDEAKGKKGREYAKAVIVTSIIKKAAASVKTEVPSTGIAPTAPASAPVTPAPATVSESVSKLSESLIEAEIVKNDSGDGYLLIDNQGAIIVDAATEEELKPILEKYNRQDEEIRKKIKAQQVPTISFSDIEDTYKREDFPDSQANTRTPITQKLLDYFAAVAGIPKYTEDLSTGTYISWLINASEQASRIGYEVSTLLNSPKRAFDAIAKYEKELEELQKTAPVSEYSKLKVGDVINVTSKEDPNVTGTLTVSEIESPDFIRFNMDLSDGTKESAIGYSEKEFDDLFRIKEGGAKPAAPTGGAFANRKKGNNIDNEAYRLKLAEEANKFEGENWTKLEQWLKKNFPNLPIYRVKNVLRTTNGLQAWGKFRDGAIYIFENAEVGTGYHEVFEAVWKMFADANERVAVLKEFRARKGSYTDAFTGKQVEYAKATDQEIKEQLAEEFRDYVLFGKIPAKPTVGKPGILKLFADLVNFIKEFFTGAKAQTNTANLFAKIGNGYYKDYIPFETNLSYAKAGIIDIEDAPPTAEDEYRLDRVPGVQRGEIMQQMTYSLLSALTRTNQSIFQISKLGAKKKETYNDLRESVLAVLGNKADAYDKDLNEGLITKEVHASKVEPIAKLYNEVHDNWEQFIEEHEEFLKPYGIEFDENDDLQLKDEDKTKETDNIDARKVDGFRKANAAVKMLLATVPISRIVDGKPQIVPNTIGGATLLPADKVFITLKNELYNAINLDDMLEKFRKFALGNPNYWSLYRRLTKNLPTETDKYTKVTAKHDWQLMGAFWKLMKGQNPDVKTVFVLPTGDIVVGDANLSSAAAQAKFDAMNDIISTIRDGKNKYVVYNSATKTFDSTTSIDKVELNPSEISSYTEFLKQIGIDFNIKDARKLRGNQKTLFIEAVNGIRSSMAKMKEVKSLNKYSLNMDKRLIQLGAVKATIENPDFESTYFNLNGQRVQTYLGTNALSNLHDVISTLKNFSELAGTKYGYLLTDVFTSTVKNGKPISGGSSVILKRIFNIEGGTGDRIARTEDILQTAYVDGTVNEVNGKRKESSRLNYRERFLQEINLNSNGYYLNLVPGDASIEHAVKLHDADDPFISESTFKATGLQKVIDIFADYFISEVELARDNRKIVDVKGRSSKDLRFFKSILGEDLHNAIISEKNSKYTSEQLYYGKDKFKGYKEQIDAAVESFINNEARETEEALRNYGAVFFGPEGLEVEGLEFAEKEKFTQEDLSRNLKVLSANYAIANIELHKLLYSDPYQYKDELKRVKSFNSPRQALMDSDEVNAALEKTYNEGYKPGDVGYTEMSRNYLNSTALDDVFSTDDLYEDAFEETDGGGYISDKANRWVRLKAGNWNENEEEQYKYDVAYYKLVRKPEQLTKEEKKKYKIEDPSTLSKEKAAEQFSKFLKLNPAVRSAYTTLKPIVSGNKDDGNNYNDIVLDKFALVPLSFRVLHQLNPNSNAVRFAEKMMEQNLDYAVYNTGRKVGNTVSTPLYTKKGEFNTEPFREINRIPFSIMGIQTEVPSKEDEFVTQGSQMTKLVTMDMLEAGVPIDFKPERGIDERFIEWMSLSEKEKEKSEIYRLVKENQKLLEERIDHNYQRLLNKLGMKETEEGLVLENPKKLIKSLEDEILKREVNANIFAAFKGFEKGQVVLEATPTYQQLRYVLFSIADKTVISPKIKGGQKVQISVALFEDNKIEAKEVNGKMAYVSTTLDFYRNEDGKRVCEVMVGRWFDNKFTKDMTDEELLNYLNETPEGQKILKGIAFRIPSQKQNSIDAFKIKKFLPKEFGDNVVIPSALVKKVGSDFDIDKLSMYFKNVFSGIGGKLQLVPFYGYGEQAKEKFKDLFYDVLQSKIDRKEAKKISVSNLQKLFGDISIGVATEKATAKWVPIFREMFADQIVDGKLSVRDIEQIFIDKLEGIQKNIDELTDFDIQEMYANEYKEKMYKESLENAYVESLEKLVTHPLNFENLVKANSAEEMKDLTKDILRETNQSSFDYTSVGNILNRGFMSQLRHAFVTGKYAIGIAAVGQTNNAQNQRSLIYINDEMLESDAISLTDKKFLGDAQFNFEEYNSIMVKGKKRPTLSMTKDASKDKAKRRSISDIIGQFIDGYVDISKGPWIMQLGATPNVASTWLFLLKAGVPVRTVAYFMNQPIIRDYLKRLDSSGYTWLFNGRAIQDILEDYDRGADSSVNPTLVESELEKMLSGELNDQQVAQQRYVLSEFLKYAKMAEHLLYVTQGSNFDTATINDPFIVLKKRMQIAKARATVLSSVKRNDENNEIEVVPAVDSILSTSFIGKLKDAIYNIRDVFSKILISDRTSDDPTRPSTREVLEAVLLPYVNENDRDFVDIARRAVSDLFDWAFQTNTQINSQVEEILLGKGGKKSAAKQIMSFVKTVKEDSNHPLFNNILINSFKLISSDKEGTPDNLQIVGKGTKAYDQNQVIFAFNELIGYLKQTNPNLRKQLLRLSVLQSGLSNSPISFTTLLPYEEFVDIYNSTLFIIDKMPNLADFYRVSAFQRANARNGDIVPFSKAKIRESKNKKGYWYNPAELFRSKALTNAMSKGLIPDTFVFSTNSREGANDFITYSWERYITKAQKAEARRKGNKDHVNTVLLKKVYKSDGKPLIQYSSYQGVEYENFVYKAVNAWGDSIRAKEFYNAMAYDQNGQPKFVSNTSATISRPSALDNGFKKVKEVEDGVIERLVEGNNPAPTTGTVASVPKNPASIGTIQLELIEDLVQQGKAKTTVRNYDKPSGVYTSTKTGNLYDIVNRGKVKIVGERVVGQNVSYTLDEFGAAEGFDNWANFVKVAKFAGKDLIEGKEVYLYDIYPVNKVKSPATSKVETKTEESVTIEDEGSIVYSEEVGDVGLTVGSTKEGYVNVRFDGREEIIEVRKDELTPASVEELREASVYDTYEKFIGEMVTIDNAVLRVLDVTEAEDYYAKIVKVQSKSGRIFPVVVTFNEETNETEYQVSPTDEELGVDPNMFDTDDFKC